MSTSIDNKVVSMQFDNSQFESKVHKTLGTLKELKEKLNMKEAAKSFEDVNNSLNRIDLTKLINAAEVVERRFSAMGIAGMTVISNLTTSAMESLRNISNKITNMIYTGGLSRAMNIEKAKFQLEGLGVTWKSVFGDIDYAVTNTAYSLDAAAIAASSLVASGVEIGNDISDTLRALGYAGEIGENGLDSMAVSLKAISGVAAQTQSDYSSIASIFTTVAGQGRLMTMQLRQLETRGLNVAAKIGEVIGKTEAEVRDMVSKGLIDYDTFATTMFTLFADHAAEANRTLTGVTANIRSAFSRIGADFIQPIIQNEGPLVNMLEEIRKRINYFKKALNDWKAGAQLDDLVSADLIELINGITAAIKRFPMKNVVVFTHAIGDIYKGISALAHNMKPFFDVLKQDFRDVFPAKSIDRVKEFGEKVRDALTNFIYVKDVIHRVGKEDIDNNGINAIMDGYREVFESTEVANKHLENLRRSLKGFWAALDIGKQAVSALTIPFKALLHELFPVFDGLSDASGSLGDFLVKLDENIKENGTFIKVGEKMAEVIHLIGKGIRYVIDVLKDVKGRLDFSGFSDGIMAGIHRLGESFKRGKHSGLSGFIDEVKSQKTTLQKIATVISTVFSGIATVIDAVMPTIKTIGGVIVTVLKNFGSALGTLFSNTDFKEFAKLLTSGFFIHLLTKLVSGLKGLLSTGKMPFFGHFASTLDTLQVSLKKWQENLKADSLKKIAVSVAILAGSIVVLSGVDTDKVVSGLMSIGALLGMLVITMKSLTNSFNGMGTIKDGFFKNFLSIPDQFAQSAKMASAGSLILKLAASLLIMAAAIKMLSGIEPEKMITGTMAIGAMLLMLTSMAKSLKSTESNLNVGAKGLIKMGVALLIMAAAVKKFGEMDPKVLLQGGVAFTAIMAIFSTLGQNKDIAENSKGIKKIASAMLLVGLAMIPLTASITILGKQGPKMLYGLGAIIALLAAMSGIAIGIKKLDISASDIAKLNGFAAAMVVLGIAMIPLTAAITAMGALGNKVWTGVAVIAALMAIMEAILLLNDHIVLIDQTSILSIGAALIALGVAMTLLAPALALIGALPIANIIKGLVAIAAIIAGVIIAAKFSEMAAGGLLIMSAAALALSTSALILGIAIQTISVGILALATALGGSVNIILGSIKQFLIGVITLEPEIKAAAVTAFGGLIDAVIEVAPKLKELTSGLVGVIIFGILGGLTENLDAMLDGLIIFVNTVLDSLANAFENGKITQLVNSIARILAVIVKNVIPIAESMIMGLWDEWTESADRSYERVETYLNNHIKNNEHGSSGKFGFTSLNEITDMLEYAELVKNGIYKMAEDEVLVSQAASGTAYNEERVKHDIEVLAQHYTDAFWEGLSKSDPEKYKAAVEAGIIEPIGLSLGKLDDMAGETGKTSAEDLKKNLEKALGNYTIPAEFKLDPNELTKSLMPAFDTFETDVEDKGKDTGKKYVLGLLEGVSGKKMDTDDPYSVFALLNDPSVTKFAQEHGYNLGVIFADDIAKATEEAKFDAKMKEFGMGTEQKMVAATLAELSGVKFNPDDIVGWLNNEEVKKAAEENGYDIGTIFHEAIIKGLMQNKGLKPQINNVMNDGAHTAEEAWEVNSPSKRFYRIGKFGMEGLKNGVVAMGSKVSSAVSAVAGESLMTMQSSIDKISSLLTDNIDASPVITPVLNIDGALRDANTLSSMLNGTSTFRLAAQVQSSIDANQNRDTGIINAINKLGKKFGDISPTTYNINGITYDDGSNVASAVESLVHAARVERRA